MATYTELVTKVKDWSNRSDISDAVVGDFLAIAQKKINNTLRIPPMEQLVQIAVTANTDTIAVPADMIEVIYLRTLKSDGTTDIVFESKTDARNFVLTVLPSPTSVGTKGVFTRIGSNYRVSPMIIATEAAPTVVEIYYYRVLPELNATYDIGTCSIATDPVIGPEVNCTGTFTMTDSLESPQWFRDEADEVLLYGALAELWSYYGEGEEEARWARKFEMKIEDLRKEENKRQNTGGTTTVNIYSNLI